MAKRAVLIDISSDTKKFVKGSKDAEQAAKSLKDKVEDAGKAIALAYTAKKVIDFGAAAVRAAVDDAAAQVTLRKALENTTGARDEDVASVEAWIAKTQNASGILDDELRPALGTLLATTRDVAKSQELLGLAMDIARAKGLPLETVTAALAKAYAGQTTALGRLVPGLRQAGETTLSFADAKDRLNQMFGGQAAAWAETDAGKMARLNAQWSDMQETIGTALLPALSKVADVVAAMFGWFNSLDDGTKDLIVTLGLAAGALYVAGTAFNALRVASAALGLSGPILIGFAAAVGVVAAAIAIFGDEETDAERNARAMNDSLHNGAAAFDANKVAALNAADAVREYGAAAFEAVDKAVRDQILGNENLVGGLNALELKIDDVTAAMHGDVDAQARVVAARRRAVESGQVQVKTMAGMIARQEDLDAALEQWIETGTAATRVGVGINVMLDDQGAGIIAVTKEMNSQNEGFAENIELTKKQAAAGDVQAAAWLKATGNLEGLTDAQRAAIDATLASTQAAEDNAGAWDEEKSAAYTRSLEAMAKAQRKVGIFGAESNTVLASTIRIATDVGGGFDRAASAADSFRRAIEEINGPALGLEEAGRRIRDNADAVAAAIAENGRTLDINTKAGRENREELQRSADGLKDYAAQMVANGATNEEAAAFVNSMTAQLREQMVAVGESGAEFDDYIRILGLTPDQVETAVKIAGDQQARARIEAFKGLLGTIPESEATEIQALIDAGQYAAAAERLAALTRPRVVKVSVDVSGGSRSANNLAFTASARESGGPVKAGRPYVVGEKRPELFVPAVDGTIVPRVPTGAGGHFGSTVGGVTVNVNAPVYGVDDLRSVIVSAWRDLQREANAPRRLVTT